MKGVREKKMGETRSLEKWVFVHEYRGSDKQKRMIKENVWLFLEEGTSWGIFFFFFPNVPCAFIFDKRIKEILNDNSNDKEVASRLNSYSK